MGERRLGRARIPTARRALSLRLGSPIASRAHGANPATCTGPQVNRHAPDRQAPEGMTEPPGRIPAGPAGRFAGPREGRIPGIGGGKSPSSSIDTAAGAASGRTNKGPPCERSLLDTQQCFRNLTRRRWDSPRTRPGLRGAKLKALHFKGRPRRLTAVAGGPGNP